MNRFGHAHRTQEIVLGFRVGGVGLPFGHLGGQQFYHLEHRGGARLNDTEQQRCRSEARLLPTPSSPRLFI